MNVGIRVAYIGGWIMEMMRGMGDGGGEVVVHR